LDKVSTLHPVNLSVAKDDIRHVHRDYFLQLLSKPQSCINSINRDMADVPKNLYRRYLEVSEATFQA
jgi:hypothetical protein